MADTALTYALTTVARVKSRMAITDTGFDTVFISYVNAVTDLIERLANRRFKETTYTNEVYSVSDDNFKHLILKQNPVSSVTSVQYKAGTKTVPTWTDFLADEWELMEDGASGILQFIGNVPRGVNSVRATYVAGYKIDFTTYGTIATHSLPADITDLAERLVIKKFKRREAEGKSSEGVAGASVTWEDLLTESDKEVINAYKRVQFF